MVLQRGPAVYRGDVVNAIIAALEKGKPGIYELSGAEEMTINQFIRLVNQNPQVKINHGIGASLLRFVVVYLCRNIIERMISALNAGRAAEIFRWLI